MDRRTLLAGGLALPATIMIGSGLPAAAADPPSAFAEPAVPVWIERVPVSDVSKGRGSLIVWTKPVGRRWVSTIVRQFRNDGIRLDAWRINGISAHRITGDPTHGQPGIVTPLVQPGNLEYAFRVVKKPYLGGSHGYEVQTGEVLRRAGTEVAFEDLPTDQTLPSGTSFELSQSSDLFDPVAGGTKIGELGVTHTFTPAGIRIEWTIRWVATVAFDLVYGAMLPAFQEITNKLRFDGQTEIICLTNPPVPQPHLNAQGAELWLTTPVDGSMGVHVKPDFFNEYEHSAGRGCWVWPVPGTYNKVYGTRVYYDTETVTNGSTWHLDASYQFSYPL